MGGWALETLSPLTDFEARVIRALGFGACLPAAKGLDNHFHLTKAIPNKNWPSAEPLSVSEKAVLKQGGARGLEASPTSLEGLKNRTKFSLQVIAECRNIAAQTLTLKEVSRLLHAPEDMVIVESNRTPPSLLALTLEDSTPVFFGWQFSDSGRLPHLAELLVSAEAIDRPLTLTRFMLTPTADLDGLSPREWLLSGYELGPVKTLSMFMTQT